MSGLWEKLLHILAATDPAVQPESLLNRQPQAVHKVILKQYNYPAGNQIVLTLGKFWVRIEIKKQV